MIIKKDSKIVKSKVKKKSLALEAKKESSDEECSTSGNEDEEYAMAVRNFKKFFKRRGKNQRAFVESSWSDSGEEDDEKVKQETCLVAHTSNEAAPKIIMGSPPAMPESKKSVSFQNSILGPKPKHIIVNNVRVPIANDNEVLALLFSEAGVIHVNWISFEHCIECRGNRKLFSTYKAYNGGNVIFGSNLRGNIIVKGQICDSKCRVTFSEHDSEITKDDKVIVDDDLDEDEEIKITKKKNLENDIVDESLDIDEIVNIMESRNHPLENVIGNLNQRTLRSQAHNQKLNQFIANDVWELVPQPRNMKIIGTKWVFRNKLYKNGVVSQNKARLVAQGYNQQKGIDYDETYASVARLESIRILLANACALDFKLFQMDVKSTFLNGFINEDVYVAQPPRFIDFEKPDHVYKLKKALYGLKQAPKAWYDRLKAFFIKHEYKMGMVDNILFTKKKSSNIIIAQINVDDIIFGLTCQDMCDEFAKITRDEFEMSMMRKLNFFGLQIKQMENGLSYPKGTGIEIVVNANSDHAGDYVNRKSTSGICTFVGCCLTSWFSKKQIALAISTTKAEYISTEKACQQALWMKQALIDYDVRLDDVPIMCDNKGVINLSKNPVQHSRTKHIKIRHHFLHDNV
uniref:Copia protein n=1 Tax=Tanacetum cinerariifolium TaxID=118510 RepID=A0A6L2MW91_TANCI|nr:copia protein [Tanacetum cinerariifolium]